jgi:hypothetical protein
VSWGARFDDPIALANGRKLLMLRDAATHITNLPKKESDLTANQQNVANAINTFFNSGGALPPNFAGVFGLSGSNRANALSQLSGEAATGAERGAFDLMNEFLGLMLDPLVYGGATETTSAAARSALRLINRRACRPMWRSPMPGCSRRRRNKPSRSTGPHGARASAAAPRPTAIRRSDQIM